MNWPDNTPDVTPVEYRAGLFLKRDDLYAFAGIRGGKVRSCRSIIEGFGVGLQGVVTASSRSSPQMAIVARLAQRYGVAARCHIPAGKETHEIKDAAAHGAEIVRHSPGYNSVICARAVQDAEVRQWGYVPFGMEHRLAVANNQRQAAELVRMIDSGAIDKPKRIVMPIGSGMSAAGVSRGIEQANCKIPILGVRVGGDPFKRLSQYAPTWPRAMSVVQSKHPYEHAVEAAVDGVVVDPHYEAKCVEYLEPGDLFWIVGIRSEDE